MAELAHIIAVTSRPHEIEECCVPVARASARVALLRKRFDTVFIFRTFTSTRKSEWQGLDG